jgi:calcineurin-like phosphoesterase family protein
MGVVRFIADLHLSHKNMAIHRGFNNYEEHDEHIIKNWNNVVNKRDTVWILGDVTLNKSKPYEILNKLNGIKKVVLGNHDEPQHVPELLKYVNKVAGMIDYKKEFILTHCPIHPSQLDYRYSYNIHGHVHTKSIEDPRYINVCAEMIDYTPKTLEELLIINKSK